MSRAERFFSDMTNEGLLDCYDHYRQNGIIENLSLNFFETKLEWSNSLEDEMVKRTKLNKQEIQSSDLAALKRVLGIKTLQENTDRNQNIESKNQTTLSMTTNEANSIVIPFNAQISSGGNISDLSNQLQIIIDEYESKGYKYNRMEQVDTYISGSEGCFGIGATPQRTATFHLLIFKGN